MDWEDLVLFLGEVFERFGVLVDCADDLDIGREELGQPEGDTGFVVGFGVDEVVYSLDDDHNLG